MKPITGKLARQIYAILVKECGARSHEIEDFIYHQICGSPEFRFQGDLGFGGKFWNTNNRLYVNCYPENLTPERWTMIDRANELLKAL